MTLDEFRAVLEMLSFEFDVGDMSQRTVFLRKAIAAAATIAYEKDRSIAADLLIVAATARQTLHSRTH